jgi:hypothetical protein
MDSSAKKKRSGKSIPCLHHCSGFAQLDVVIYLSVKQKYYDDQEANNKLIAILQVDKLFNTHQTGFDGLSKIIPSHYQCRWKAANINT